MWMRCATWCGMGHRDVRWAGGRVSGQRNGLCEEWRAFGWGEAATQRNVRNLPLSRRGFDEFFHRAGELTVGEHHQTVTAQAAQADVRAHPIYTPPITAAWV